MRLRGLLLGLLLALLGGAPAFASIPAGDFWSETLENTTGTVTLTETYSVPDGKHLVLSGGQLVNGSTFVVGSSVGSGQSGVSIWDSGVVFDFGTPTAVNGFYFTSSNTSSSNLAVTSIVMQAWNGSAWADFKTWSPGGVFSYDGNHTTTANATKYRVFVYTAGGTGYWGAQGFGVPRFFNVVGPQFAGIRDAVNLEYVPLFNESNNIEHALNLHFKGPTTLTLYTTNFTRAHFYGYLADYQVCTVDGTSSSPAPTSTPAPSSDPSSAPSATPTPAPDASVSPDPNATTYVLGFDHTQASELLYKLDVLAGVVFLFVLGGLGVRLVWRFI